MQREKKIITIGLAIDDQHVIADFLPMISQFHCENARWQVHTESPIFWVIERQELLRSPMFSSVLCLIGSFTFLAATQVSVSDRECDRRFLKLIATSSSSSVCSCR